jgi:hypothetical protein
MGSDFFCPYCHALLRKSPLDQAYSKTSGLIVTGNWQYSIRCPACGENIDRMEIINGKYDKKWWQFFDMGKLPSENKSAPSNNSLPQNYGELNRAELEEILNRAELEEIELKE